MMQLGEVLFNKVTNELWDMATTNVGRPTRDLVDKDLYFLVRMETWESVNSPITIVWKQENQ